jgi:hypothetical protein
MTTYPEDDPRTLREVGIILRLMRREINELNARLDSIRNLLLMGLVCPIIVGVVVTVIMK